MEGILLVDKPKGWTSFDVVNYTRRIVAAIEGKKPKNCKVGHTGTLDPMATGLLVLLVGKAYTRRAVTLSKLDKTYKVTMKLGEKSTTGDEEGDKTLISKGVPTLEDITSALSLFTGEIEQIPPAYSAMKIDGKRAYELARAGKEVKLKPRPVTIYESTLDSYEYPYVYFTCSVSSGTYIRTLVEDLGTKLGVGAYMSDLRRMRIGDCELASAVQVKEIDGANLATKLMKLE